MDASFAESFGLDRPRGALVQSTEEGGPAEKAGIKPGDIILSVNGRPVENNSALPALISSIRPGNSAELEIWSDRKLRKVTAKVAELQEAGKTAQNAPGSSGGGAAVEPGALGLSVRPLTAAEKQQIETEGSLVVENVTGQAEEADIRPGDVILGVAGLRVKTQAELQTAIQRAGRTVALRIQREDRTIFVPVRAE
jgi:serine protease Do